MEDRRWLVEISMLGNREDFLVKKEGETIRATKVGGEAPFSWVGEKSELQDFLDHMYNLNKQFHVYSISEIPGAKPMT